MSAKTRSESPEHEEKTKKRKVNFSDGLSVLEQTVYMDTENKNYDHALEKLLHFINFSEHAFMDHVLVY